METLLVLIMLVIVLDIASLRWGFDSTEKLDSPEWERRTNWSAHLARSNHASEKSWAFLRLLATFYQLVAQFVGRVDILLTEWDTSRSIQRCREFKPEYKQQLLGELAWHFHLKGQRYFPDREVKAVIAGFLPAVGLPAEQSGKVLEEVANENGMLKAQAQGWHGFLHLTLQEYFVARYVTDHQKQEELLIHRGNPWWEEVLQLYAGQTPDASLLLQKLLGQGDEEELREDLFYTNLILAGRCLAARPTVRQISLRKEVTSRLFDLLTTTPYALTREQVANTLAAIGGVEVNTSAVWSLLLVRLRPTISTLIQSQRHLLLGQGMAFPTSLHLAHASAREAQVSRLLTTVEGLLIAMFTPLLGWWIDTHGSVDAVLVSMGLVFLGMLLAGRVLAALALAQRRGRSPRRDVFGVTRFTPPSAALGLARPAW